MAAIVFDDCVGVDIGQGLHGPAALSRRLGGPEDVVDGLADHRDKGHDERHRGYARRGVDVDVGDIHARFHHLESRLRLVLLQIQVDDVVRGCLYPPVLRRHVGERDVRDQDLDRMAQHRIVDLRPIHPDVLGSDILMSWRPRNPLHPP